MLEDNLTFDINMYVTYSRDKDVFIPTSSYSNLTGFVMGYKWVYESITTDKYKLGEETKFDVMGILEWHLLGVKIYSEGKTFSGVIEANK